MNRCTQPGCTGTIEDGYCNICGSPAGAPSAPPIGTNAGGTAAGGGRTGTGTGNGGAASGTGNGNGGAAGGTGNGNGAMSGGTTGTRPTSGTAATAGSSRATSSARLASTPMGSARMHGTRPTRRLGTTRATRANRLGAGLTTIPSAPVADPRTVVMSNPEVSEEKRFCSACGSPVGRTKGDKPGRTEGFCPKCRTPFSFTPKLQPGELVGGQYEVVGCLAHGGLGWIYLAMDKNVSDRWVVLKGLLNTGDKDAFEAAVAERQFLAEVEHPLIVEIYNFVMHAGAGYTVMEYVGGKSLKQILKERMAANGGRYSPIPVDQAIAYILEVLPAFAYLHSTGLLYCDFKPDNIIQQGDSIKLIDLGGVRRVDDETSAIFGTVGYQAPEVADEGPSIPSDLFTIGRTLTVLATELRGYQSTYATTFPPVDEIPLFREHDSLYRLLTKCCAADADDRFQSAEELRDQLLGVLREIVAKSDDHLATHSSVSTLFEPPRVAGGDLTWAELPVLRVDPNDAMANWLSGVNLPDPKERMKQLRGAAEQTVEVRLALMRAAIEAGDDKAVEGLSNAILTDDPWEWRAIYLSGLGSLARGDAAAAVASFNAVYGQVPGELAPKLALALACEQAGELGDARMLYEVCARTDANYVAPAAFGIHRVLLRTGDVDGAIAALDLVPPTSRAFTDARRARALLRARATELRTLAAAVDDVESVTVAPIDRQRLVVAVLESALFTVQKHGGDRQVKIAGYPADERSLRLGLEQSYRQLADLTDDRAERVRLVSAANKVRPFTLV